MQFALPISPPSMQHTTLDVLGLCESQLAAAPRPGVNAAFETAQRFNRNTAKLCAMCCLFGGSAQHPITYGF